MSDWGPFLLNQLVSKTVRPLLGHGDFGCQFCFRLLGNTDAQLVR
jgi:hypothetical protein